MKIESEEFYSNCFIEAAKAKLKNKDIKLMYIPAFLNEVMCPHWMWSDESSEHDFWHEGKIPWYKWFWHKGMIRTLKKGCYKKYIEQMIQVKYYGGDCK